jgi:hypothetical protein
MDTATETKPNLAQRAVAGWKKHERKILIATTVISTASAVMMRSGLHQHNEFLKERGLFDEFYNVTDEV